MAFNRYHKWLGISPKIKRPTYYQLLGVDFEEKDIDVIQSAAEKQRSHVQQFEQGANHQEAAQLLSELDDAELTLASPKLRRNYNRRFNLNKNNAQHSGIKTSGGRTVGEGSGLFREYLGIMSVILGGFIIMAAVSFFLPWQKLVGNNQEEDTKPIPEPEEVATQAPPMEPENSPDQPEAKEEITEIIYSVQISPPDAQLKSDSDGVVISGEGRQRKVVVSKPNEVEDFILTSSCFGFKNHEQNIQLVSKNRNLEIRLEPSSVGEIRTIQVDQGKVFDVLFSKDGRWFATGGENHVIKIWDTKTGIKQKTLRGHKSWVYCLALSPDGSTLASGGSLKTIRLWDWKSGKSTSVLKDHSGHVMALDFTSDNQNLISVSLQNRAKDQSIRKWRLSDQTATKSRIKARGTIPWSLATHPDGKRAYIVHNKKNIPIQQLDIISANIKSGFNGHKDRVWCITVAPNGKHAASGSAPVTGNMFGGDNSIRMWNCDTGRESRRFRAREFRPGCIVFSPDGKWLLTGDVWKGWWANSKPDPSIGCSVRIWDVATGRELHRFKGHKDTITSVAFSPDGRFIASSSYDGTVRFWRTPTH